MRAVVWTSYGPPESLRLVDVPRPIPGPKEVLVRIRATSVTAGDCELRGLRFGLGFRLLVRLSMGLTRPRRKVLGQEFSGVVEGMGPGVESWRVGDEVFGTTGFGFGAYADYLCLPESANDAVLASKPSNISFEEAATIPTGGLEALHFLRAAGPLEGKQVLIVGAGGGIGIPAVQLARSLGAEVTGVDTSGKLELMSRFGAARVMDFAREDYTKSSGAYDVIFDVVGRSRFSACLRALRPGGCYLLGNPGFGAIVRAHRGWARNGKRVIAHGSRPKREELDFLRQLVESGKLRSPIDSRFPLEDVPAAHRRVESGLALGRVAITV